MADRFINISREQSEKSSSSLLLTFSHFFSPLFLCSLSFFLRHIRERKRDGERERVFSFVVWGRRRRNYPVLSLSLSLSLSLCFSLSRCDAYRSDRR